MAAREGVEVFSELAALLGGAECLSEADLRAKVVEVRERLAALAVGDSKAHAVPSKTIVAAASAASAPSAPGIGTVASKSPQQLQLRPPPRPPPPPLAEEDEEEDEERDDGCAAGEGRRTLDLDAALVGSAFADEADGSTTPVFDASMTPGYDPSLLKTPAMMCWPSPEPWRFYEEGAIHRWDGGLPANLAEALRADAPGQCDEPAPAAATGLVGRAPKASLSASAAASSALGTGVRGSVGRSSSSGSRSPWPNCSTAVASALSPAAQRSNSLLAGHPSGIVAGTTPSSEPQRLRPEELVAVSPKPPPLSPGLPRKSRDASAALAAAPDAVNTDAGCGASSLPAPATALAPTMCKDGGTIGQEDWRPRLSSEASLGVASSPSQPPQRLAVAGDDGRVRLLRAPRGEAEREIPWSKLLWSVTWSPAGDQIAFGSDNGAACIVDAESGDFLLQVEHARAVRCVAWSPSGSMLATGSGRDLRLLDSATGKVKLEVSHRLFLWSIAFSPNGERIATGSEDKRLRVLNGVTGKSELEVVHGGIVFSVAWSPLGASLATGSNDCMLRIIDALTGNIQLKVKHGGPVRAVCWNPRGGLVATGSGGGNPAESKARVIDPATGVVQLAVEHVGFVRALAWDTKGCWLASGGDDGILRVINYNDGRIEWEDCLGSYVRSLSWSPDG